MKLSKLFSIIIIPTALLFGGCNSSGNKTTENDGDHARPNIILILSDDQAWTDYGFMGHDHIQTPHIDRLAREGCTFTRGYVPTSLCRPSLASIITGLYPHQHGILGNDPVFPGREKLGYEKEFFIQRGIFDKGNQERFEKLTSLPDLLKEKGYVSFQSGKWWEGNYSTGGFDSGMTLGDPRQGGRHGDEGLAIGREGMAPVFRFIDDAAEKEQPFFLWYAPFMPHRPHTPPDTLLEKYIDVAPSVNVAAYWAMCEWFDYTCGQLTDYIDKLELTENTVFVYVCDNGWEQEIDGGDFTARSKRSPYDLGIRTPIIFKWQGKIESAVDTLSPVSSTDIFPTVLEMLGIERPDQLPGINILDAGERAERNVIPCEVYAHDFSTIDSSIYYRIAVTTPYKLIVPDETNMSGKEVQLYNLIEDPFEQDNLAKKEPGIVKDLRTFLISNE